MEFLQSLDLEYITLFIYVSSYKRGFTLFLPHFETRFENQFWAINQRIWISCFQIKTLLFCARIWIRKYLELLQSHAIPALRCKHALSSTILQEDLDSQQWSEIFSKSQFPEERIIAKGLGQPWPRHSPDLSLQTIGSEVFSKFLSNITAQNLRTSLHYS